MLQFTLTQEQRMFKNAARDFAENEIAPRVEDAEEGERFPQDLWPKFAINGYLCPGLPEEAGGAGATRMLECLAMEEFARICYGIASSWFVQSMVPVVVNKLANEEQRQRYVLPCPKAQKFASFGLTEPNAGSDVRSIQTTARKLNGNYVINGSKMFITNATFADYVVVVAYVESDVGPKSMSLFLVNKGTLGFRVARKLKKEGSRSSETAELIFEDCTIGPESLLGEEGKGFKGVLSFLSGNRIVIGARGVGVAQAAYELALDYAKQRVQFGQPIGKNQALAFELADILTHIEAGRRLVYYAADLYDNELPFDREASMAKYFTSELAVRAASSAMQILGGYGQMREFPAGRYLRDAKIGTVGEGTSQIQLRIISRSLGLL